MLSKLLKAFYAIQSGRIVKGGWIEWHYTFGKWIKLRMHFIFVNVWFCREAGIKVGGGKLFKSIDTAAIMTVVIVKFKSNPAISKLCTCSIFIKTDVFFRKLSSSMRTAQRSYMEQHLHLKCISQQNLYWHAKQRREQKKTILETHIQSHELRQLCFI